VENILIAVAPNGARRTKENHRALPVSPVELAKTAAACAEAGAGMIHLHVRDAQGNHSLNPDFYRRAIKEVEAAVGRSMVIQVSSEAAGLYGPAEQMELIGRLAPRCVSIGLREFVGDSRYIDRAAQFFHSFHISGVLLQYILYSPAEVVLYGQLCRQGVIPGEDHFLLFVVGNYGERNREIFSVEEYLERLSGNNKWMACGFGDNEHLVAEEAIRLGGHVRVGFENNLYLPDGSMAENNEELVRLTAETVVKMNRKPGSATFAETLFG
jgi:uncharacterized protein (DUF849 family)